MSDDRVNLKEFLDGNEGVEFSAKILQVLRKPGVYLYVRKDRAIYVGATKHGLGRPMSSRHHHVKDFAKVKDASLLFLPCKSEKEAFALEKKMIRDLQPVLNRRKDTLMFVSADAIR